MTGEGCFIRPTCSLNTRAGCSLDLREACSELKGFDGKSCVPHACLPKVGYDLRTASFRASAAATDPKLNRGKKGFPMNRTEPEKTLRTQVQCVLNFHVTVSCIGQFNFSNARYRFLHVSLLSTIISARHLFLLLRTALQHTVGSDCPCIVDVHSSLQNNCILHGWLPVPNRRECVQPVLSQIHSS